MTVHQRQSSAPTYNRTGRSSRSASAKASRLHGCQLTGWRAARARYGVAAWAIRLASGPCSVTHATARTAHSKGRARRVDIGIDGNIHTPALLHVPRGMLRHGNHDHPE